MDGEVQQQWFHKWEAQVGAEKAMAFQKFLHDDNCPQRIRELAQEPLLLYLLAAMHRDGQLKPEIFAGSSETQAKILIYQKSLDWVLTKQRPEWLQKDLTEQDTEDLRRILTEAGLCIMQSGGECAPISMIEQRLKENETAKEFLEAARERIGENPLRNALAAFYLQPGKQTGSVEFTHKSFSEFLFAERLKQSLEDWTEVRRRGKGFNIQQAIMDSEVYDLLGYGGLTPEVVEYLMNLVTTSNEFQPIPLFQRLEGFYQRWCEGEFINAHIKTLPHEKSRRLHEQNIELGQRQVDIYAGLNVMILLLELNRYAQKKDDLKEKIVFYPLDCLENNRSKNQLLHVINYSDVIEIGTFNNLVSRYLSGAYLSGAYLSGADLSGADLSGAYLSRADLSRADLGGAKLVYADLSGANLSRAYLSHAKLSGADLSGAKLIDADLNGAYLSGADLSGAYLSGAKLSGADLSGADLSGAYLSGAKLVYADLSCAYLSGTNLSGAKLSGTKLIDTDLRGAKLINTDLHGAKVENARFGCDQGISSELKLELIRRGAIFEGSPGDRSAVMIPG